MLGVLIVLLYCLIISSYTIVESKTKGTHYKKTMRLAKQARELYQQGNTTQEIANKLDKSVMTINRAYIMTGGISMVDKALHYRSRYLKRPAGE